jgi:hypothetical protein
MENLPAYVSVVFIIATLLTLYIFYEASHSKTVLLILSCWLMLQGIISYSGFYVQTKGIPPRFILLVLPPFLVIIFFFLTAAGKRWIDHLEAKKLTILHIVRIPVELVLLWLSIYGKVPELMTFEGRNFDILSGITAPFIWYFGYVKKRLSWKIILVWNIVCLLLLINIVVNAILSAPFAFQRFAFDQPNIGVLYFPFSWLPCCIVPVVLFSHLVCIRQLLNKKAQQHTSDEL